MAMLAGPRRKQKWTLNPRGNHWSDDSTKFGQKMLEKMGWSSGKGLGLNQQGMTEHVRVKFKDDQAGIGFSKHDEDKMWTEQQESFNDLLQKLQSDINPETSLNPVKDLSGTSLELKSKQSRARVHYRKFTRGKDVNKYSTKDLANIFGKKDLNEKQIVKIIPEQPIEEISSPIGASDTTSGILTIKGGTMSDYLKSKVSMISSLSKKLSADDNEKAESESENERYVGFGFSQSPANKAIESINHATENNYMEVKAPEQTPKKRKSEFFVDNPPLDVVEINNFSSTPKKRKLPSFAFENPGLDLASPEPSPNNKKSKIECVLTPDTSVIECISQFDHSTTNSAKKKKKKRSNESGVINKALNLEVNEDVTENTLKNGMDFEVTRDAVGLANDALDLTDEAIGKKRVTFNDIVEYNTDSPKKKKKKSSGKLDKFEVEVKTVKKKKKSKKTPQSDTSKVNTFVNEALDVEIINEELADNEENEKKSKKTKKRKDTSKVVNLETIEEEDDVKMTDEIVTLNDTLVEKTNNCFQDMALSTPNKKKKQKKDKDSRIVTVDISEEVCQEKEKKKKRKEKKETALSDDICISNESIKKENTGKVEEMEIKIEPDIFEGNSNKENQSVFKDSMEEDCQGGKKNKKSKKEREVSLEGNVTVLDDAKDSADISMNITPTFVGESQVKKSKKMFKVLAKKSILEFSGSNINDIKGYGVDL